MSYVVPPPPPVSGPTVGPDRAILTGYLGYQRRTLLNVCAGLDGERLAARPAGPSSLSLLGLLRHLRKVERIWLRQRVAGEDVPDLYGGPGDPADFSDGTAGEAESAVADLQAEWAACGAAVADLPWDHEITVHHGTWSLAMVYVHLVAEYARHNGHADLLREHLDGVTGR